MQTLAVTLIKFYQKNITPVYSWPIFDFWSGCRFYPSCSEYSLKALNKYGLLKGVIKSLIRILRCGPWSKGGVNYP